MSTCILFLYVSLCCIAYMYITKTQKHNTYINVFHGSTPTHKNTKTNEDNFSREYYYVGMVDIFSYVVIKKHFFHFSIVLL